MIEGLLFILILLCIGILVVQLRAQRVSPPIPVVAPVEALEIPMPAPVAVAKEAVIHHPAAPGREDQDWLAMMLDAMQRGGSAAAIENSTSTVTLPTDDLKGRIVGREGRNMRAFEQVTGVDLLIDETPGTVVLSSFDPYRREVAKVTLEKLLKDGKIQPSRIEETYAEAAKEVERQSLDNARHAAQLAGVGNLNNEILKAVGRLRYRTSYAQNVLEHSIECARIAGILATELGMDAEKVKRAAFLHDIGKSLGPEWEGPHALAGMRFLQAQGEKEPILNAVGAHHREIPPNCPEAELVIIADSLSASRPGARREAADAILQRQRRLEEIALELDGVDRAVAVQAGRELRVLVNPGTIDDAGALQIAEEITKRIGAERTQSNLPRLIVTVIRELRIEKEVR